MASYIDVFVADSKYHGKEFLTYHWDHKLPAGTLVEVNLRGVSVNGFVVNNSSNKKPKKTKELSFASKYSLPQQLVDTAIWISQYYPAGLGKIGQLFLPSYVDLKKVTSITTNNSGAEAKLPPLTKNQSAVLKSIKSSKSRSFLLHGDTGSGKTRIYIELIKETLESGKSGILLAPEISLTPQLHHELKQIFKDKVLVLHSKQKKTENFETWSKILLAKSPLVVVGPRSALFAPLKDIGVIAIDEMHEPAYKNEQQPRYQTGRVAAALAKFHGARIISGSATPLINEYFLAKSKDIPILRLAGLAISSKDIYKDIQIVDIKERGHFTSHPMISNPLIEAIDSALNNGNQALIYLNRRGSARTVVCNNCGWRADCPRCSLPLIYHLDKHQLRCHTCGFIQKPYVSCPQCKSTDIIYKSFGTKAIETFIKARFPKARVARFDSDTSKDSSLPVLYDKLINNEIDIIIGTQILAKGLDLKNLGVVGVLTAEANLTFPDYSANERMFQLINQIIGRVGRGHIKGRVIIQSYSKDSPLLRAAIESDWLSLYNSELAQRKLLGFPPFWHFLKLEVSKSSKQLAEKHAQILANELAKQKGIVILGPTPKFVEKQAGKYLWQIIVKSKSRSRLLEIVAKLPSGWSYDLDPNNLL